MTTGYKLAIEGLGTMGKGYTLFEACLAAKKSGAGANVIADGRLVAFFCGWRKCVAVGFGATPNEREQIEADFGAAPALRGAK